MFSGCAGCTARDQHFFANLMQTPKILVVQYIYHISTFIYCITIYPWFFHDCICCWKFRPLIGFVAEVKPVCPPVPSFGCLNSDCPLFNYGPMLVGLIPSVFCLNRNFLFRENPLSLLRSTLGDQKDCRGSSIESWFERLTAHPLVSTPWSWEYLGILNLKSGNSTYHAEDLPPGKPRGVSQVAIDPSAQYGLAKRLQIWWK